MSDRTIKVPEIIYQVLRRHAEHMAAELGMDGPRGNRLQYAGPDGWIIIESEEQDCPTCHGTGKVGR